MSAARRFDWLFRPQAPDEDTPLSAEARFAEALAGLPAVERSALALSEIGGLDRDEIAVRLGTEPVIVETLLARARDTVRASMAGSSRVVGALTPIQAWWQSGASSPAARAVGVAAVTVLGVGFAHDARSTAPRTAPRTALASPDQVVPSRPVVRTSAQSPAPVRVVRAAPAVSAERAPQRRAAAKPVAIPLTPRRSPGTRVQPPAPVTVAAAPAPQPAAADPALEPTARIEPLSPEAPPPSSPTPLPVEVPPLPIETEPPPLPALEPALPPLPPLPPLG